MVLLSITKWTKWILCLAQHSGKISQSTIANCQMENGVCFIIHFLTALIKAHVCE